MIEKLDELIIDLCGEVKEKNYMPKDKFLLIKALALLVEARAKLF